MSVARKPRGRRSPPDSYAVTGRACRYFAYFATYGRARCRPTLRRTRAQAAVVRDVGGGMRDVKGLRLTADATLGRPQLDVVPSSSHRRGVPVMHDVEVLDWVARQARGAHAVFSVCTGALFAVRRASSSVVGRRRIGRRSICCLFSGQCRGERARRGRRGLGLRSRRHGQDRARK